MAARYLSSFGDDFNWIRQLKYKIIRNGSEEISTEEINQIQKTVSLFPKLSRNELAQTLCEHMDWHSPSGAPKISACLTLLRQLHDQGLVLLPDKIANGRSTLDKAPKLSERTNEKAPKKGSLQTFSPITLKMLNKNSDIQLWNEYVERYHPLGHKRPFGNWLRYFLLHRDEILGCILVSGASRTSKCRDSWIGWNPVQRQRNLSWVVNNSRYLILPWVHIPNLASHVLAQLTRCVAKDWETRWGYRPVLIETFVDCQRYTGTCYHAAGWEKVGITSGRGVARPGKHYTSSPKHILAKPLDPQFRALLCSEQLQGRILE